jgi:pimeloyl-ACP methyl ester carboxylesterase
LRAALYAQRHPERIARLVLSAFVWTGKGSPTLAERTKKLPQYLATNRRKIDRAFVNSMFTRDHDGGAEQAVIDAYADAILALDDSVPTGHVRRYVLESCRWSSRKRSPHRRSSCAASTTASRRWKTCSEFFKRLPKPDKQFAVMPGIAHNSTKALNYEIAYHILLAFLTQPAPVYRG